MTQKKTIRTNYIKWLIETSARPDNKNSPPKHIICPVRQAVFLAYKPVVADLL
jgi:hypothetical protein